MRQESPEKKIIETLQQYSSPDPDPAFEARLKDQFLQKAREAKRKRTFFRGVGWTAATAASVLIGVMAYDQLSYGPGNQAQQLSQEQTDKNLTAAVEVNSSWKPVDTKQLEPVDLDPTAMDSLALFMSPDRKKLYAVKGQHGLLVYQANDMNISIGKVYPFPNDPDLHYVWLAEDQETPEGMKRIHHVFLIKKDHVLEMSHIPQSGYNMNFKLEWSPSGKKAYLAVGNGEEWAVGQLNAKELAYKPVYGEITDPVSPKQLSQEPKDPLVWQAAWVNDSEILVFNPLARAFYGVNPETRSAWEYKAVLPKLPKGHYVKDIIIAQGIKQKMAIFKIGKLNLDASFSGTEHLYKLNLDTHEILPIDPVLAKSQAFYDQYHLRDGDSEDKPLIGKVYSSDQKQFELQVGLYDLIANDYVSASVYKKTLNAPAYIHIGAVTLSPDREAIALRVLTYPPDGGSKEYLCVFNRLTGKELIPPISKEFISNVEFVDNHTIKADEKIINLD